MKIGTFEIGAGKIDLGQVQPFEIGPLQVAPRTPDAGVGEKLRGAGCGRVGQKHPRQEDKSEKSDHQPTALFVRSQAGPLIIGWGHVVINGCAI
jgi:hypothetical protein